MPNANTETGIASSVTLAEFHGLGHSSDDTWHYFHHPDLVLPEHGWKLHVSARGANFGATVDEVLHIALRYRCHLKFARDTEVLRGLNSGTDYPAAVGKAVTVYPAPEATVKLGNELAGTLRGREGPKVLSDRRILPDAPVYYRYGPFRPSYRMTVDGEAEPVMTGPDGTVFPALAETGYRCPPWARDPFEDDHQPHGLGTGTRTENRYRVTAGVKRSPQGHVYRATDTATDQPVIVKQGRAFVNEDPHGTDARDRIRHERRVLAALADVEGVSQLVDHFGDGEDEYLVTTSCGATDLRADLRHHGPYDGGPGREWSRLAARLLRILDDVHAHGVVLRDLTPGNVVIDEHGNPHIVDFGIAELDGVHAAGGTRGYFPPGAEPNAPGDPADDYFALGATLHFAATGLDPVVVDNDEAVNRTRTLECLAAMHSRQHPAHGTVAGLLSHDAAKRVAAAERMRRGDRQPLGSPSAPPEITTGLLDEIIDHTLTYCIGEAETLAPPAATHRDRPLLGLFTGSSGLGNELLRHPARSDARETAARLARWTANVELPDSLPPGLYCGSTGIMLFLAEAAGVLGDTDLVEAARAHELRGAALTHWVDTAGRLDQFHGHSGIGLGQLLLAHNARDAGRHADEHRHLSIAGECARLVRAGEYTSHGPAGTAPDMWEHGFAHGHAGVAYFLFEHHRLAGDATSGEFAHDALTALAARARELVAAHSDPAVTGRAYGSWCNGLTGIATVLLRAGMWYPDEPWLDDALTATRTCLRHAPRMALVHRCCGLSGVGELLVDAALATGEEWCWRGARDVAGLILTRSGGPPRAPVLPDHTRGSPSPTWGTGATGVLSFLRRLRDGGGPRPCMPDLG